jgi:Tol biopolymer transport system component/DNA-binding winged helix-turn-helix (wHTH) protein
MPSQLRQEEKFPTHDGQLIRFDRYQVDVRSGELRKEGRKVRLQAQPFQLLALLLRNAGRVVSREDVKRELWPGDTFVDFDHGLAAAVNKVREALCDSADKPKFVETLPRRGYRFIGKIEPEPPVEIRVRVAGLPQASEIADSANTMATARAEAGPSRGLYRTRTIAGFLLGAAMALGAAMIWLRPSPGVPSQEAWTTTQFTAYPGLQAAPAFSPDGSRIAFSWDHNGEDDSSHAVGFDLYVKGIGGEALLQLTHRPSDWISSAWSPDGTQIAIHRVAGADTGLYLVAALGGPERKLRPTHIPYNLSAQLSWSPDGKWLAYGDDLIEGKRGDRIFLLSMETLESHLFFHDPACRNEANLTFSHSGKQVAWLCVHGLDSFEILIADPAGHGRKSVITLPQIVQGIAWSRDDTKLVVSQVTGVEDDLVEVGVKDGSARKLDAATGGFWPSVSPATGAIASNAVRYRKSLWRKELTKPHSPVEPFLVSSRDEDNAEYSPDGKRIAFDSTRSGMWNVWVADADGGNLSQVSRGGDAGFPRWSPDSKSIVYMQRTGDARTIFVVDVNEREPRKLVTNIADPGNPFWSHDGKWIYFPDYGAFYRRYYRSLATGGETTLVRDGPKAFATQESFDGTAWYYADGDGETRIYREPVKDGHVGPGSAVPGMPFLAGDCLWTIGKNGIYFVPDGKPQTVTHFDFATQKTKELFTVEKELTSGLAVSSDERYMLLAQLREIHSEIMLTEPKR